MNSELACLSRRSFLLRGGASIAIVALPGFAWGSGKTVMAAQAKYSRKKIGSLSDLKLGEPLGFTYPDPNVQNILIKIGTKAGGGVGPEMDIVAFNQQCTHMGGPLHGSYKREFQVLGPCPLHLTTFDLSRHGMVVSGHATESLPQILLEVQNDEIYAVGVMGLVFGHCEMEIS